MLLSELLRPELIKTGLEALSKREAISELVDVLVQQHEIPMNLRYEALQCVLRQEAELSSGLTRGIAIPHGSTDKIEDMLCAVGISKDGVDFDTRDGKKAHIVVLVVAPKRNFVGEVRTLTGVQHLLDHPGLGEKLLAAANGQQAYDAIEKEEHSG